MRSIKPTPASIEKWKSLTRYQQSEVVAWAAAHIDRNRDRYRTQIPASVLRFAAGMREIREDRRKAPDLVEKPALIALVKAKWTRAQERAAKPEDWIPERIKLTVPIPDPREKKGKKALEQALFATGEPDTSKRSQWKRRTVAIPVDVAVEGAPSADAAASAPHAQRMFVFSKSKRSVLGGVACARVKKRGAGETAQYLLTCHHVAFRSQRSQTLRPDRSARIFSGISEKVPGSDKEKVRPMTEIGSPSGRSLLKPRKTNQLDGGLIKLNAAGIQLAARASYWRVRPVDWVKERARWLSFVQHSNPKPTLTLHPWGRRATVPMKFLRHEANRKISYAGRSTAAIVEVFVFRCLRGGSTEGGYSGSPITVKLQGGKRGLVAMHIAGERVDGVAYSYAIPTYWLFPKNLLLESALELA